MMYKKFKLIFILIILINISCSKKISLKKSKETTEDKLFLQESKTMAF